MLQNIIRSGLHRILIYIFITFICPNRTSERSLTVVLIVGLITGQYTQDNLRFKNIYICRKKQPVVLVFILTSNILGVNISGQML